MNKRKVILPLALVASSLAACGGGGTSSQGNATKDYTLRQYTSGSPTNWNPHTWEDSSYEEIVNYSEIGLVDFSYDPSTEGGYKIVYEMANAINDVTTDASVVNAEFKEKWGIQDGQTGRVWKIDLNPDAKFASGLAINADTYVESMKLLLDESLKNYRANTYYSGDASLVGAYTYYMAGETSLTNVQSIPASGVSVGDTVYLDWAHSPLWADGFGVNWDAAKDPNFAYASYFKNAAGENIITKYLEATELTDAVFADIKTASVWSALGFSGDDEIKAYVSSKQVTFQQANFDDVGLVKAGEDTLYYITEQPISFFNFATSVTSLWLVNPDLYKANIATSGGVKTSSYGTSVDKYDSFGPYKLETFEANKQFTFVRNPNWYGWTDGKHEGQFQTTKIVTEVIPEHSTALLAFEKGDLDGITLEQSDLARFGSSEYLRHTPQTYTMRLVFDSNLTDLAALETSAGDGANKKILHYEKFREAISLSIDRTRFNKEGTAGNEAAYALLNSLYYYDVENDPSSIYRNTDEAKKAITDLYGMEYGEGKTYKTLDEAYKAVTGLDVDKARSLFTEAYQEAIKDGNYTDGQAIKLNVGLYDATTASSTAQIRLLNEFVGAAVKGTKLEGKITFVGKSFTGTPNRYDAIENGQVEIANCAWGGAAFYPFSTLRVYCDPSYTGINEARSWDPTSTTLTLTYDWDGDGKATELKKTYQGWSQAIGAAGGEFYTANTALKLHVLARLENALLGQFNFAVLGSYASVSLVGQKVSYPTDVYNIMYGYGGIRYMTYNFDDASWASYVKQNGGTLHYE